MAIEEHKQRLQRLNEQKTRASLHYINEITHQLDKEMKFYKLSIPDGCIAKDEQINNLCIDLIKEIQQGRVIYVHCYGGHGRSGTLCAVLLA